MWLGWPKPQNESDGLSPPQAAGSGANTSTRPSAQALARTPASAAPLMGYEECQLATEPSDTQEASSTGKKMGLCLGSLHHLPQFCPGRCTLFLTFLDHGLVQKTHCRLIHGLKIGEAVVGALVDLVPCHFLSPCCPWSWFCLFRPTLTTYTWGGHRRDQDCLAAGALDTSSCRAK